MPWLTPFTSGVWHLATSWHWQSTWQQITFPCYLITEIPWGLDTDSSPSNYADLANDSVLIDFKNKILSLQAVKCHECRDRGGVITHNGKAICEDDKPKCFPSSAIVNLENEKSVTMSELQKGDQVQTGIYFAVSRKYKMSEWVLYSLP